MDRVRHGAGAVVVAGAVLVLAVAPAVAAPDSVSERLISSLNERLLYIAVPIALLVEFILVYTVWRFRDADEPRPTRTNRQLEITWTVATALVLLFVGVASYTVLTSPFVAAIPGHSHGGGQGGHSHGGTAQIKQEPPPDAVEVRVVAEQWFYTFVYPDAGVATRDTLVLPTDRPVYLYVTSEDVIHSVHVPDLGMKQDALPGQYNLIRARLTEQGEYRLYCAEFCGTGHAAMRATVRVVALDEYRAWLDEQRTGTATAGDARSGTATATNGTASWNGSTPTRTTAP